MWEVQAVSNSVLGFLRALRGGCLAVKSLGSPLQRK